MFRLQNNVPEIYVEESRDFQIFCRLLDTVYSPLKYTTDSILHTVDTKTCDARLLELLKTKLGIFTKIELSTRELRYLLQAFPVMIRYKGSLQGIQLVLNLFQRINQNVNQNVNFQATFHIDHNEVIIKFGEAFQNDELLYILLNYILPSGYSVRVVVQKQSIRNTVLGVSDTVSMLLSDPFDASQVHAEEDEPTISQELHMVGMTPVVSRSDKLNEVRSIQTILLESESVEQIQEEGDDSSDV